MVTESSETTAIVPVATQPSESTALVSVPPTEETAIVPVPQNENEEETEAQEQAQENELSPVGSGYIYDDEVLNEVLFDQFGTRRAEQKNVE